MLPKDNLSNSFPSNPPSANDIENFCTAAKSGDVTTVQRYLDDYGADIVNAQDSIKARAITWAAWGGYNDVIKLLLDRGAEIDAHGTSGKTALSWAADTGHFETFALLLDRGASLDDKDDSGTSALDWARRSSNTSITELVNQQLDEKARALKEAQERQELRTESEARAAVADRLRKLKDGAGKIKIQSHPNKRGGPGNK